MNGHEHAETKNLYLLQKSGETFTTLKMQCLLAVPWATVFVFSLQALNTTPPPNLHSRCMGGGKEEQDFLSVERPEAKNEYLLQAKRYHDFTVFAQIFAPNFCAKSQQELSTRTIISHYPYAYIGSLQSTIYRPSDTHCHLPFDRPPSRLQPAYNTRKPESSHTREPPCPSPGRHNHPLAHLETPKPIHHS